MEEPRTRLIRERALSTGWYPQTGPEINAYVRSLGLPPELPGEGKSRAAISPHAGWAYSGLLAVRAIRALGDAETVAIIGGHLPPGAPFLYAPEEGVRTPLGLMPLDRELRDALIERFSEQEFKPDLSRDNSVEVLVPLVRYFFPRARLLWMRFPPDHSAYLAGQYLASEAWHLDRRVVVLGSTDLTHYGENYDFAPEGYGERAVIWARRNDKAFIQAVTRGNPEPILRRALDKSAACSAGAVLGALGFVAPMGQFKLLEYSSSVPARGDIPTSFVGYAALA